MAPRLRDVAFLAACLLYWRYRLEPQLTWYGAGIVRVWVFSLDPLWLRDQLALPAGPLVLFSNYVVQWFYLPWAGPVTMLASVILLMAVTQRLADQLVGRRVAGIRFLPALMAAVLFNGLHHQLVVVLGAALAGEAALWYLRLPESRSGWRVAYLAVVLPALFFVTAGAYLINVAVVVVVELRSQQRRILGLLTIVYAEALPWAFTILWFDRPIADAYLDLLPVSRLDGVVPFTVTALWLTFPLLALALPKLAGAPPKPHRWAWPALAAGMLLAGWLGFNPALHELLVFNRAYRQQNWARVVTLAEAMPRPQQGSFVSYAYLRALHETGRLPEDMLRIHQSRYSLFLHANPADRINVTELRAQSYLLLGDLTLQQGSVNEAEHDAVEAIEIYGPVPMALQQLAKVRILKGQPEAARILLRNLLAVPGWRAWAQAMLARLDTDPTLAGDDELNRIRRRATTIDRKKLIFRFPEAAYDLLTCDPGNRCAFEYLMVCYLLDSRPDIAVGELHRLAGLGYRTMPTLYQEAALVVEAVTGKAVDLAGYRIEPEVRERFERFLKACEVDADELEALTQAGYAPTPALRREFGDRYYFYFVFNDSGFDR